MSTRGAVNAALAALDEARDAHPRWPVDPMHALAILGEEYGELQRAVVEATYSGGRRDHIRAEAAQVAAMALRFLSNIDAYEIGEGCLEDEGCDA